LKELKIALLIITVGSISTSYSLAGNLMGKLHKILTVKQWEDFQREGIFSGSPLDQQDGFIHASTQDQYQRTIDKFFKDIRPIILVEIDPKLLQADTLKVEANKPGGDKYPHIYGDIPLAAIITHKVIDKYE
jgi:uncharacterized protein (DUF952 family)